MTWWLTALIVIVSLVAMVLTVLMLVRDESPPGDRYFVVLGVLLVALLAQAIGGSVALAATERAVEGVTFVAYLFTALLVVPVGAALALVERSRWGTGVLVVMLLTVLACEVRLHDLWTGAA